MTQRKIMTGAAALLLAATLLAGASGAQARTKMSSKHPKPSTHKKMKHTSKKGKAAKGKAYPIPAPGAITTPYPPVR